MAKKDLEDSNGLNKGDSVGLLGLLFAVFAFVIVPTIWIKGILLLLVVPIIAIAIRYSHWTHRWSKTRRLVTLISTAGLLLMVGAAQINEQLKTSHRADLSEFVDRGTRLAETLLSKHWLHNSLWLLGGALLLRCIQVLSVAVRVNVGVSNNVKLAEKGFLDHKHQTENAIKDLSPALAAITKITNHVGITVQELAQRTKAAPSMSTTAHLRLIRISARKLNSSSIQLDAKCYRLEAIGSALEEGMIGWFDWINRSAGAKEEFVTAGQSLRGLCSSIAVGIKQTNRYIANLERAKGISADMNMALNAHTRAITRVRNANELILHSCVRGLQILDGREQRN